MRGSQSRCRRPRPSSTNAGPWTPDAGVDLQHRIIDACVQRAEDGGQLKRMLLLLLLQTNVLPRARARRRANAMAEDELDSHTHTHTCARYLRLPKPKPIARLNWPGVDRASALVAIQQIAAGAPRAEHASNCIRLDAPQGSF